MNEGFHFPTFSAMLVIVCFFFLILSVVGGELISHWGFGFPFLANDGEHLLCAYWPLCISLENTHSGPFLYFLPIICLLITGIRTWYYSWKCAFFQRWHQRKATHPLKDQLFQNCPPKDRERSILLATLPIPPPLMFPHKACPSPALSGFPCKSQVSSYWSVLSGESIWDSWSDVQLCVWQ